jgi:Lecithin retinol acyltransferase
MIQNQLIPGTVLQVWSRQFLVYHKGIVDWYDPISGQPRVIHSIKGSFVESTSLAEFANGEPVAILSVPQTRHQQVLVLQRMHSIEGKPYHLLNANCEHVVNWALTGNAHSEQLTVCALLAVLALGAYGIVKGRTA